MSKTLTKVLSLLSLPLLLSASIFNEKAIDKIGLKTYNELKTTYEQKNANKMSQPSRINAMKRTISSITALQEKAKIQDKLSLIIWIQEEFYPGGILTKQALQEQNQKLSAKHRDIIYKLGMINPKYHTKAKAMAKYPFVFVNIEAEDLDKILNIEGISKITEAKDSTAQLTESAPIIGADTAWSNGFSGEGQTIAVIDEGINTEHDFFTGKVVFEACFSGVNGHNDYNSLCPDGDASSTAQYSACSDVAIAAGDDCIHGTHVAGIAVGKDDANSIYGVAKDASLIAIQTGSHRESDGAIISNPVDHMRAISQVIELKDQHNIAAVNLSSGGGNYNTHCDDESSLTALIDDLKSYDIAFISTSGNEYNANGIHSPACVSSAIAVGSTNDTTAYNITIDTVTTRYYPDESLESEQACATFSDDNDICLYNQADIVSAFSNSAAIVDLLAPGARIDSADATNLAGYRGKSGTSMAAPQVAGAFAVLKSAKPDLTVDEIEAVLKSTGKLITDEAKAPTITKPRIDIDKALDAALLNPNGIRVLIVGAEGLILGSNQRIKEYLLKTGRFQTVNTYNSSNGTPTFVFTLQFYDAVLVYSRSTHADPDTLGDELANYIDAGGAVVTAMYSNTTDKGISGNFNETIIGKLGETKNYWAILPSDGSTGSSAASLSVNVINHPILKGVTTLNIDSIRPLPGNIQASAVSIANWSDGTPAIVTREIEGVRRVDLGFLPTTSSLTSSAGEPTKDGDIVVANALEWVANKFNESLVPITSYLLD